MRKLLIGAPQPSALLAHRRVGARRTAKNYTFALVPKNMNNPFFDQARDGCKKAEKELERRDRMPATSAPASTAAATSRCRSSTT